MVDNNNLRQWIDFLLIIYSQSNGSFQCYIWIKELVYRDKSILKVPASAGNKPSQNNIRLISWPDNPWISRRTSEHGFQNKKIASAYSWYAWARDSRLWRATAELFNLQFFKYIFIYINFLKRDSCWGT